KRWIVSSADFAQFGFDANQIQRVDGPTVAGPDVTATWQVRPGLLLQAPGDAPVYLVDSDGTLRHIPDAATFQNLYGTTDTSGAQKHDLSGLTIAADLASGAYLATDGVNNYLVEPPTANNQGHKHLITSQPIFDQFAFASSKVQSVDPATLAGL